jgi:hypothetical protein
VVRRRCLRRRHVVDKVFELTKIDPWFLTQIKEIVDLELAVEKRDFFVDRRGTALS